MIDQHLFDRVRAPATVRAGLIGAGQFGTPIVTQAPIIPRLDVPVVADLDVEAGRRAFRLAGLEDETIRVCESHASALRALEAGKQVVLQDASLMMDAGEVADAFATLRQSGKVLHLGVSNFTPSQFDLLSSRWLLKHPARIVPILGTGKADRVRDAVQAPTRETYWTGWASWGRMAACPPQL